MAQEGQGVDLAQLPIPQLNQVAQQLDQEAEFLQRSVQQLRVAQGKFKESKECLDQLEQETEGKKILVPLTSSLYIPGELADNKNVLIDIGTNYYIERSLTDAKDYFERKADYLSAHVKKVEPALVEKMRTKQAVREVLQHKMQLQMQQQQAAAKK